MSFYTVGFRDQIGALPGGDLLVAELDRVAAFSKTIETSIAALGGNITDLAAAQGLDTGKTIQTLPTDASLLPTGVRWLTGPWLINADGNTAPANGAALRFRLTSDVNDFAPAGIDTAIVLELDADGAHTITGIRVAATQRRFLVVVNRSGFTLTFTVNDPLSQPSNRFEFSPLPGELLQLPAGTLMLLYYEVSAGRWHLSGIPMVPTANLPASLKPVGALAHGRQWFGFRAGSVGGGGTPLVYGIGCGNPTIDGVAVDASFGAYSYVQSTSAVYAGIRWSGISQQAVRYDQHPIVRMRVKTYSSLASTTLWAGINDTEPTTTIANTNAIMFRYQAGVDAGWTAAVCDGGAVVTTAPIAPIGVNTEYTLQIRIDPVSAICYLSVDGGITEVSIAGHLPFSVMLNAWFIRAYSQIGGTVGILFSEGMCEYGDPASGLY